MYRRPKFLEVLLEIRREMALEADYDVDLFAEMTRAGSRTVLRTRGTGRSYSDSAVDEHETVGLARTRDD